MRTLTLAALSLLTACHGGGGANSQPQPAAVNPAPQPGPAQGVNVNMDGVWRITQTDVTLNTSPAAAPQPVGRIVVIQAGVALGSGVDIHSLSYVDRVSLEATAGFSLDWYQNESTAATCDFGYGWDRLRVAGGGGQHDDYVQYGFRVAAVNNNLLVGYEAEERQPYLGVGRTKWIASHLLMRQ